MKVALGKPYINQQEIDAVTEVLKSGWYANGPKNTEFETMFASYIGVKYAISVNSGTAALFLSLLAMDITGEVIVPSFSFVASANAIVTAGATPVFVDVDYDTGNILLDRIKEAITPNTQAIMCVHYAGQSCLMDGIEEVCKKHNLKLIEDSAECIGGTFNNQRTGSFGDTGCFSFFPTKNITTGEGGMVTTNSEELNRKIRALLAHGIEKDTLARQETTMPWQRSATYAGYNFRLSNILAAIGVEQMKKIDEMNKMRQSHGAFLNQHLADIPWLEIPVVKEKCEHVYQMYTIRVKNGKRNEVLKYLISNGIEASVHFDPAIHQQTYYKDHLFPRGDLSNTEKLVETLITLPLYPHLTNEEMNYVVDTLHKFH